MNLRRLQWLVLAALTSCFLSTSFLVAADNPGSEPKLTLEQEEELLLHAKVIKSHQTSKGVTAPWRLTLTDGTITHDAVFQPVDERNAPHRQLMRDVRKCIALLASGIRGKQIVHQL